MSERRIALSEPFLGGNERQYLNECIDTNLVSSVGPFVDRFEREFAAWVGARHAVACSSGTAAVHVALRLLGLQPGDEVFVSTLTFVASANPILYERGVPVLVDAERESWNLDPSLVAEELDRRARRGLRQPRAVEAVHILGQPARIAELVATCERHGVALFEDASEALGGRYADGPYAGRQVGTIGRLGCFSFNGNKVMTAGGGGMVTTDDPELARRAKHLTTQARLPGLEYRHDEVGYNYRLTNLAAALGLGQLEQLADLLARKRRIAGRYDAALAEVAGIQPPPRPSWSTPTHWLYSVLVDPAAFGLDRRDLHARLRDVGIETRPIWSPLHSMELYADAPLLGSGGVAEDLFAHAVSLPCSAGLQPQDQDFVIEALAKAPAQGSPTPSSRAEC
ncbi:MAG: aminotransferase class I/II-fold pyridoxal phosphate-dependent enzyme [Vicinamibacteria bacterium]